MRIVKWCIAAAVSLIIATMVNSPMIAADKPGIDAIVSTLKKDDPNAALMAMQAYWQKNGVLGVANLIFSRDRDRCRDGVNIEQTARKVGAVTHRDSSVAQGAQRFHPVGRKRPHSRR